MPWSVTSVIDEWIDYRQGTLQGDIVDQAVTLDTSFLIDVLRGNDAVAEWERELDEAVSGS